MLNKSYEFGNSAQCQQTDESLVGSVVHQIKLQNSYFSTVILSEMYLFQRAFLDKYKYKYKYLKKCRYLPIQIADTIYRGNTSE